MRNQITVVVNIAYIYMHMYMVCTHTARNQDEAFVYLYVVVGKLALHLDHFDLYAVSPDIAYWNTSSYEDGKSVPHVRPNAETQRAFEYADVRP